MVTASVQAAQSQDVAWGSLKLLPRPSYNHNWFLDTVMTVKKTYFQSSILLERGNQKKTNLDKLSERFLFLFISQLLNLGP